MAVEFDCCECKQHVVQVAADRPPEPPLCATCLTIPGWHEDPVLRKTFGHFDDIMKP